MGAGVQRWWRDFAAECDRFDRVQSREFTAGCTITRYEDGRVTYQWEQEGITLDVGRPRFIGYDPRTGACYEIPEPESY
jgi:hypothetical protein